MNEKQLGILVIAPLVVATAALLMRQGALGWKGMALVTLATLAVATFMFTTL
ncbi:MAG: hypothetical protein NVV74_10840 [Magnetospirillum sp.]|nr:hypothetical protein [Magnetospirillum sp.]